MHAIPESELHMDPHEECSFVPWEGLTIAADGRFEPAPHHPVGSSLSSAECTCPTDCIRDHETD